MYCLTLAQWQVKQCVHSESYRAHGLQADRVLDEGNISEYCLLLPSEFICCWISFDEGFHVWWNQGQIIKVINLKKHPKILFIGIVYKVT